MFNWELFWTIWAMFGIMVLVGFWLMVTIACAWGAFGKRFQITWGIFTALLITIGTIVLGFTVK